MALLLGAQPGRALSYGAAVLAAHFRTAPQSWPRTFVRRRSPGRALSYGAAVLAAHFRTAPQSWPRTLGAAAVRLGARWSARLRIVAQQDGGG